MTLLPSITPISSVPTQQPCRESGSSTRTQPPSRIHSLKTSLAIIIAVAAVSTAAAAPSLPLAPYPVGGFAICQTRSSLHIQGGVGYGPEGTYLTTTNQHFRLDLSKGFDSSLSSATPPTWANLTSDYSPYQRFHSGDCTPDQHSFLTIGNADEVNTGESGSGFLMAYSITKGTWTAVNQAVSGATNPNQPQGDDKKDDKEKDEEKDEGKDGEKGGKGGKVGISAAGRTMVGFAIGRGQGTDKTVSSLGVAIGGGWIPPTAKTPSTTASSLTNLVAEIDLIGTGSDGSVDSITWSVANNAGNGGNSNLGAIAGTRVVILPSANGKAVILGGAINGVRGGLPFVNVRIIDLTTGVVSLQKTAAASLLGTPAPRYGHCAALSSDGNTIFMFGGSRADNDQITNDFYALDTRTWTWFEPPIKPSGVSPPPVRDHQCIVIGDQFISVFGFNSNQAPASRAPLANSDTSARSAPPIYVLSTSQWAWSTQFTPLEGTPAPPTPPIVPTDGSKGKVSGAVIAFSTIFGMAFMGVIGYMVFAHKRRQRRKAEHVQLVELENQKKEEAKREKERQQRMQQDVPSTPSSPMMAHTYNANYHGYGDGNDYGDASMGYYPPQTSVPYGQAPDPFQNSNYSQQLYSGPPYVQGQYYDNNSAAAAAGMVNPFEPHGLNTYGDSPRYVAEEMGHASPAVSGRSVGDKTSFVEPSSAFRGR
ncbi:hypothetical protein BGX27_010434 [Mortierella sp. AM989]|nr:hypothetical protein BGX27_010434 [Mortierella sp. AM989]